MACLKCKNYRESVAGSNGGILGWFVDREPPKGLKWPVEGLNYTWGSTLGSVCTHLGSFGGRLKFNLLSPRGCLVST